MYSAAPTVNNAVLYSVAPTINSAVVFTGNIVRKVGLMLNIFTMRIKDEGDQDNGRGHFS